MRDIECYIKEFTENPNYVNYSNLVMAFLKSPNEDYLSAVELVKKNYMGYEDLSLVYIATYLAIEWYLDSLYWINYLDRCIDSVDDKDKSIIFYLKSCYVEVAEGNDVPNYKLYLEESIKYSHNMKFYNNYRDLALISPDMATSLLETAETNIKCYIDPHEIDESYFYDPHFWIEERILGIIKMID